MSKHRVAVLKVVSRQLSVTAAASEYGLSRQHLQRLLRRRATPKALAAGSRAGGHFRLRYDVADRNGAITLRRGGRLHHLKIGAVHARRRVLAIVDERDVTIVALDTGEVLSSHLIDPDRSYWRNQRRDPGRWPGSPTTG